tara:strand:+ start:1215 stop:1472 length:258 start_codon:yes stop_codon:yes gene_type:complete
MPKISTYATSTPASGDLLIGSDLNATPAKSTKNFTVGSVLDFFNGNAVPASATATGIKGQIAADATHLYICTATNTWKRVGIATF